MSGVLWSEVKIIVPGSQSELVAAILQDEGAGGVVYDDPEILKQVDLTDDEYLGKEFGEQLPEENAVRAFFPVDDRLGERLERVQRRLQTMVGFPVQLRLKQVREEDWAEAWKQYFKPERIGRAVIKPSWEEYLPAADEIVIELDPGMAFGTGTHPTTRMCLRLLQEYVDGPLEMLDIGTGSGILAVLAAKLGAARVVATDIDPMAVKIARENAERNQVQDVVTAVEGDLLQFGIEQSFQLVTANIIANAILTIIPDLDRVMAAGGRFIASGIIAERYPEVEAALTKKGFAILQVMRDDGWVAVVARYKG